MFFDIVSVGAFLFAISTGRYLRPYLSFALQVHAISYCYAFQYALFAAFPRIQREHDSRRANRFSSRPTTGNIQNANNLGAQAPANNLSVNVMTNVILPTATEFPQVGTTSSHKTSPTSDSEISGDFSVEGAGKETHES